MINVLLIEDDLGQLREWVESLDGFEINIETATSISQAETEFPKKKWALVVVDGCIGGDDFNSPPLISKMRETYSGPMIATSKSSDLCEAMVNAGCDYRVEKKCFVPANIVHILKLRLPN